MEIKLAILNKRTMNHFVKHIEAQVTFIKSEDGGRKGPIFQGFRPTFIYDGNWWDASIFFEGLEDLPKGIPVTVFFDFASPEQHIGHLIPGKEFQLWDGRVIANGIVVKVIDLGKHKLG